MAVEAMNKALAVPEIFQGFHLVVATNDNQVKTAFDFKTHHIDINAIKYVGPTFSEF